MPSRKDTSDQPKDGNVDSSCPTDGMVCFYYIQKTGCCCSAAPGFNTNKVFRARDCHYFRPLAPREIEFPNFAHQQRGDRTERRTGSVLTMPRNKIDLFENQDGTWTAKLGSASYTGTKEKCLAWFADRGIKDVLSFIMGTSNAA